MPPGREALSFRRAGSRRQEPTLLDDWLRLVFKKNMLDKIGMPCNVGCTHLNLLAHLHKVIDQWYYLMPLLTPPEEKISRPFRSVISWLVLVLFAVGCIWGMGTLFAPPHTDVRSPSGLRVSLDALDFGTVWSQSSYRFEVEVTNASSQPVGPVRAKAFCGCTSIQPEEFTVPPGDSTTLELTLDLASQLPSRIDDLEPRPFQVLVLLSQESGQELMRFDVTGFIRPLLAVPNVIQLQTEYSPYSGLTKPHLTRISSAIPLSDLKVNCEKDIVKASVQSEDSEHWVLAVDMPPSDLEPGRFEIPLTLIPVTKSLESLPSTTLILRGSVARNYQIRPQRLDLGFVKCDTEIVKPLRLYSINGDRFAFARAESKSPEVIVEAAPLDDNHFAPHVDISLTIQIGSPGAVQSSIDCFGTSEDGREIQFILPISAIGKRDE